MLPPGSKLGYGFDWSAAGWLAEGETISSAVWSIKPDGPTISGESNTDTETACYVSGGTFGVEYVLTCTPTTSLGEIAPRSMTLRCGHQSA